MNKIIFSLAGATALVASAMLLIDCKQQRNLKPFVMPPTGELLLAFVVAATGGVLASVASQLDETKHPERAEKLQKADDKLTELATPKEN